MVSIHLSRDVEALRELTNLYEPLFDPVSFFDEGHLGVTDGYNWSLFRREKEGVYQGHYLFRVSGKRALSLSREMIKFMFIETDAKILMGLTPLDKRGARWLSRQSGFKSHGIVDDSELFIMSKEDFNG